MDTHASFICVDCREMLRLGRAVMDGDKKVCSFHRVSVVNLPNHEQTMLNRILWKMLADHAGHTLRVVIECDGETRTLCDYREVGCDDFQDLGFET
jgi:hypothetical protein